MTPAVRSLAALLGLSLFLSVARADDGIWLWNQLPKPAAGAAGATGATGTPQKRSLEITPEQADRLRLSTVRLNDGAGSGSFVSPNGLLLTNEHLVASCLSKHDHLADGFYAAGESAELTCPGFHADVLLKMEDVSVQVKGASAAKADETAKGLAKELAASPQALRERYANIAKIESECTSKTGNVCSVVKLFSGSRYDLYQYKRYADLRVVFAPEQSIAFFGRERDSISYLRYGLDIAFLRAWENGKPAATANFLKWDPSAVKDGDFVITSGNPAPTSRVITSGELTFLRDISLPRRIQRLQARISELSKLVAKGGADQAAALATLDSFLAEYKETAGKFIGLKDDRLVSRKTAFDLRIRRAVEGNPKLGMDAGKVWDEVDAAYKKWGQQDKNYQILEEEPAPGSQLFKIARDLVRGQRADPNAAINPAVETAMMTQYLDELKTVNLAQGAGGFGGRGGVGGRGGRGRAGDDFGGPGPGFGGPGPGRGGPEIKEVNLKAFLTGKTTEESAAAMVKGSKLGDPAFRATLNTKEAAAKSDDPFIRLALTVEPASQKIQKDYDDTIGSLEASAGEKIAAYRFRLFGTSEYPDGTSTPRLAYGIVKGYTDRAGTPAPFAATFSGLYYRRNNEGPYQVSQRWVDAKDKLGAVAALDFVSTADIGGGDPGAPTVNASGDLMGVTFDGNLESLPEVFLYTDEQARSVHVSTQGITEALTLVYKTDALLRELGVSGPGT
ncbi:MAG TPA: S46 family peptidase [Bryobacteraceae bacterium]|nr:S46 family peptidase [Bryobacteraceae bacterium]